MRAPLLVAFACVLCVVLVTGRAAASKPALATASRASSRAAVPVTMQPSPASARGAGWQEVHQLAGDVAVRIERDGTARIEQSLRWRVAHGELRSFDLVGIDPAAELDSTSTVSAADGRSFSARVSRQSGGAVKVAVEDPRGLPRGTFDVTVGWRVDLWKTGALVRDAATWRLRLEFPAPTEGIDGVRTILDVASSPDPPMAIRPDTGAFDAGALATLRRGTDRDVLQLVRPHVARGEAVVWTLRLGGRAVSLPNEALPPSVVIEPAPEPDRIRALSLAASLGPVAVGVAFLLLRAQSRPGSVADRATATGDPRVAAHGRTHAVGLHSLLPLPTRWRAALCGTALAAGVGLQIEEASMAGGALVALALLAAAARPAPREPLARQPGTWLALRPEDAFAEFGRGQSAWSSAVRGPWPAVWLAIATSLVGLALLARPWWAAAPWYVAMDSAVLAPLFFAQIAGARAAAGGEARWLRRLRTRLIAKSGLRVVPWARRLVDGTVDELRLLVVPRAAVPGLLGIEVGLAWSELPLGRVAHPEVLVRVHDVSAACARLKDALPRTYAAVGRRNDERVFRLAPLHDPGVGFGSTVGLIRALCEKLTERAEPAAESVRPAAERRSTLSSHAAARACVMAASSPPRQDVC